jgi:hypothetical protein
VNSVGVPGSRRLPNSRRAVSLPQARSVATAPERCGVAAHEHSILVDSFGRLLVADRNAAGGAVAIVAAEYIGSGTARDEGVGKPTAWQGRMLRGDFEVIGMTRQIQVNAGNIAAPKYECKSMHEDKPTREARDGQYQGRVAGAGSVPVASVSSIVRAPARSADEPALGVMGGLLQPVSSPAEPPVSSLSGPFAVPSTTAPAPYGDFLAGDVSPLADVTKVAWEVVPRRPHGRSGSA